MPGPSNPKKRKPKTKNQKKSSTHSRVEITEICSHVFETPVTEKSTTPEVVPPLIPPPSDEAEPAPLSSEPPNGNFDDDKFYSLLQQPVIYDPGNGPRVRDTRAFLEYQYFSQPPAWDVPLCAEFAQEEVSHMLMTILPEETALILWYNKSRETSRICPACRRLYRLGDILPDHLVDKQPHKQKPPPSPQLTREQELSGLCSPVCFILACFNYPKAIKTAWGHTEDEMDDATWDILNASPQGNIQSETSLSLGMLIRMTRLHDLGLAQLCLGLDDEELDGCYDGF